MGHKKAQTRHILRRALHCPYIPMVKSALISTTSMVYSFALIISFEVQVRRRNWANKIAFLRNAATKIRVFSFRTKKSANYFSFRYKKASQTAVLRGYKQKKDIMQSIHHQTKIVPWAMFAQTITALQMNAVLSPFQGLEIEDVSLTGGSHPRLCSVAPLALFTGQ